jgi:hypothetical protein
MFCAELGQILFALRLGSTEEPLKAVNEFAQLNAERRRCPHEAWEPVVTPNSME